MNANQIAEGVFDELNQILNNLSESIDFELYFNIQCEPTSYFTTSSEKVSETVENNENQAK